MSYMIRLIFLVSSLTTASSILYNNCNDYLRAGDTRSGLRVIGTRTGKFKVACDQETSGGGWTLIQKRVDGREPFWNRTWAEYKRGFGKVQLDTEFYLGNDLIHELTTQYGNEVTLRVELYGDQRPDSEYRNDFYYSHYNFSIANESKLYEMHINLDWMNLVGNASDGWYDITYGNGNPFSTLDRINDPMPECFTKFRIGGWWSHYCGNTALNGEYRARQWGDGYGLFFTIWGRYVINPRQVRMLVRDRRYEPSAL